MKIAHYLYGNDENFIECERLVFGFLIFCLNDFNWRAWNEWFFIDSLKSYNRMIFCNCFHFKRHIIRIWLNDFLSLEYIRIATCQRSKYIYIHRYTFTYSPIHSFTEWHLTKKKSFFFTSLITFTINSSLFIKFYSGIPFVQLNAVYLHYFPVSVFFCVLMSVKIQNQ